MGRLFLFIAFAFSSISASAEVFCASTLSHNNPVLKAVAEIAGRTEAFQTIAKKYPEGFFCTSGIALLYADMIANDVFLLEVSVRVHKRMDTVEQFHILVDGQKTWLLKFKESKRTIQKWMAALNYKSAGVMPRLPASDIAVSLKVFDESKAEPESLTAVSFRFPNNRSDVYSLVTWASALGMSAAESERVAGAVIVQDLSTGDIAVADRLDLAGLIEKLRALAVR